ncbi:hypothetical protein Q1695_007968 [Nippostrongylus brasiliensis]|nr:hypothetical protein Q1695_007968 [Nippostrongylus brasiliensis]
MLMMTKRPELPSLCRRTRIAPTSLSQSVCHETVSSEAVADHPQQQWCSLALTRQQQSKIIDVADDLNRFMFCMRMITKTIYSCHRTEECAPHLNFVVAEYAVLTHIHVFDSAFPGLLPRSSQPAKVAEPTLTMLVMTLSWLRAVAGPISST